MKSRKGIRRSLKLKVMPNSNVWQSVRFCWILRNPTNCVIAKQSTQFPWNQNRNLGFPAVRKGLELPVNAVIVIALAALTLVVISLFFSSSSGQSTRMISDSDAWARGCALAKAKACQAADFSSPGLAISSYDPDGDGNNNNLYTACYRVFQDVANPSTGTPAAGDESKCRVRCCGE